MKKSTLLFPVVLIGTMAVLGGCGDKTERKAEIVQESATEAVTTNQSGDTIVAGTESLKDEGYFKELVTHGQDPKIKEIVSYRTDFKNSDWDHITLAIDHVKLVNVDKFSDKEGNTYKELMTVNYQLKNEDSSDKHIKPDKAVLVLKDGKKVDAEFFFDYWDDEVLTQDAHKDGMIHFKIKEAHEINDISKIELTFKAKDDQNHETTHTYTIDQLTVE